MNNTKKLSREKQESLKMATRNDLINFCFFTDPQYSANYHHIAIANELENALKEALNGRHSRIILELPPRHGKSELASIKFPAWVLGNHPDLPIMVTSYSADLAVRFGSKARDLVNSDKYHAVFNTSLKEDSKAKNFWNTQQGGGYNSVGIGGSITGKGFKIGIVDDPFKNREEANSETIRQKVWDWYTSTFYTRQEGGTAIIVIMTRWHKDDLVGRLLEAEQEAILSELPKGTYDQWKVIKFPAIAEEDEEHRQEGEALWPEKFPLATLEKIKNTIGAFDWASLYQQDPINSETQEFKEEYFTYFKEEELTGEGVNLDDFVIDITIDPAISERKEACNTAITATGKFKTKPDWYVLEYVRGKLNPGKLIDATFMIYRNCKKLYPRATINVHIETVAYQKSLLYFFQERMKKEEEYFTLFEYKDTGDKQQRIRGLIPLYQTRVLHHRNHMKELEKEALEFPEGKYVDLLDALSFNLQIKENTKKNIPHYTPPSYTPSSPFGG